MAGKIQLTPGELQYQAIEMQNLESEYSTLFAGVSSTLKSVNGNWSSNLSNNFEGKINSAQKSFIQITKELMNGSKVANTCAVTFESVDSELSKLYCTDAPNGKTTIGSIILDDTEKLEEVFNFIDTNYEKIPEPYRNLIKNYILDKIKYGGKDGISYTDIYDILKDLSTGNVDWGTAADIISMGAETLGQKSSFIQALTTTLKIMPTYLDKAEINGDRIDQYISEGKIAEAIYTAFVGNGTVIIQGATDGICKIIDKTFHLSDISDGIEIITGGKIDIGGFLNNAGKNISGAVDYITDVENFDDMGRYFSDFYGGIVDGIGNTCKNVGSWFKGLFS